MNKFSKTILISERSKETRFWRAKRAMVLIISIAIFGIGLLFTPSTFAQAQNLNVEFQQKPLFNEVNFLPGESITRWVKVTNNSNLPQLIATQAINVSDPNWLGAVLILEIKEGGVTRYKNDLSRFFAAGEVTLSELAENGTQTRYDFIVTFYSGAGNPFQGKSLGFDILVGFQGKEGGLPPGAGGGAGGYLPPGLTIPEESVRVTTTTETSVTITWLTSYFSTSQVIYTREGEPHTLCLTPTPGCALGSPPKYGYAHTTPEYDVSPKVTAHSVTITGLTPGTKYYYRTVSHASLAISREYSFTTLGVEIELPEEEILPPEEEITPPEEIVEREIVEEVPEGVIGPEVAGEEIEEVPEEEEEAEIPITIPFEEEELPSLEERIRKILDFPGNLTSMLVANLGTIWKETGWLYFRAILIGFLLGVLVIIGKKGFEVYLEKKRQKTIWKP